MAFIHPVKAFKHSGLIRRRNADARIGNGNFYEILFLTKVDGDLPALSIVFYSVVAEVIEDFL